MHTNVLALKEHIYNHTVYSNYWKCPSLLSIITEHDVAMHTHANENWQHICCAVRMQANQVYVHPTQLHDFHASFSLILSNPLQFTLKGSMF